MAKFKVGDVVKVLDGSHIKDYTGNWVHDQMDAYVGKSFKIRCVEEGYGDRVGYNLELGDDEPRWLTWDERGLEFADEKPMARKFRFETNEGERYQSEGKHKGRTIPTITTTVYEDTLGDRGEATCDKNNYDERQGILEAIGNMVYGNFDREYNKFKAHKKRINDLLCKCNTCGKTYKTQEEARACEKAHVDHKKAKREKYLLNKEAKRRIAEAEREGKINDLIRQLTRKK
jgi:hypothetical protein